SQEKQLTMGINLFVGDNGEMFPPAGYATQNGASQVSWDSLIYGYIGGSASLSVQTAALGTFANDATTGGALGIGIGLPVLACPADVNLPKVNWMHFNNDQTQPLQYAIKSYEMNASGSTWVQDIQV